MKHILLIHDNLKLKLDLKNSLSADKEINIAERENAEDVITLLEIVPDIDLIIAKDIIDSDSVVQSISTYIQNNNLNIPIVNLSETEVNIEEITQKIYQAMGSEIVSAKPTKRSESFYPVSLIYFSKLKDIPCEIYKKEPNSSSNNNYKLMISLNEKISWEQIKELFSKETYAYVKADDHANFLNAVLNNLMRGLEQDISLAEKIKIYSHVYTIIKNELTSDQLNHSTVYMIETVIQDLVEVAVEINHEHQVKDLVEQVLASQCDQVFKTVYLNSIISSFVASKLIKESMEYRIKLAYLSFFADILLRDREELSIRSDSQLKNSRLEQDRKALVQNHASKTFEVIKDYKQAPPDIFKMIILHHGDKEGKRLHDSFPSDLNKLNLLFFMVDDLSVNLLLGKNFQEACLSLAEKYKSEDEVKIVQALNLIG